MPVSLLHSRSLFAVLTLHILFSSSFSVAQVRPTTIPTSRSTFATPTIAATPTPTPCKECEDGYHVVCQRPLETAFDCNGAVACVDHTACKTYLSIDACKAAGLKTKDRVDPTKIVTGAYGSLPSGLPANNIYPWIYSLCAAVHEAVHMSDGRCSGMGRCPMEMNGFMEQHLCMAHWFRELCLTQNRPAELCTDIAAGTCAYEGMYRMLGVAGNSCRGPGSKEECVEAFTECNAQRQAEMTNEEIQATCQRGYCSYVGKNDPACQEKPVPTTTPSSQTTRPATTPSPSGY